MKAGAKALQCLVHHNILLSGRRGTAMELRKVLLVSLTVSNYGIWRKFDALSRRLIVMLSVYLRQVAKFVS